MARFKLNNDPVVSATSSGEFMVGQYVEVSSTTLKELHRIALGAQMGRSGFAGQAFTNYLCLRCEKEHTHSDTSVPNFCPDCSKDLLQIFKKDMAQRGAKC